MSGSAVEFFRTVPVGQFKFSENEIENQVIAAILSDPTCVNELIQKGYISPDGKTIINPIDLRQKIRDAQLNALGAPGDKVKNIVQKFKHALGISEQDLAGIPGQAVDFSLHPGPILGQNRIAYMRMATDEYPHGLMLGGLGTGGIERTPQGDFRRVGMTSVGQNVEDLGGNRVSQFHLRLSTQSRSFAKVLNTGTKPGDKLQSWSWGLSPDNGSYHALYPMEWHRYFGDTMPGEATITSFSPVIEGNYQETSYPVVVYKIKIKNTSSEPMDASFMFTMQNLVGWRPNTVDNTWDGKAYREVERKTSMGIQPIFGSDSAKDFVSEWNPESEGNYNYIRRDDAGNVFLVLAGNSNGVVDTNGQIAIAIQETAGVEVSYVAAFDADGNGEEVKGFYESGQLPNTATGELRGKNLAGALAFRVKSLAPGESIEIPVVLSYDFPKSKQGETVLDKRYTKFFGSEGTSAVEIARFGLAHYKGWEEAVAASQRRIALDNPDLPDWYEGAVLNKLNLLQTDSVGWFNLATNNPGGYPHLIPPQGLHLMGESNKVDYCHVETFDVRAYSFATALFWPSLDQAVLNYFAETIPQSDLGEVYFKEQDAVSVAKIKAEYDKRMREAKTQKERTMIMLERKMMLAAVFGPRKLAGATPHDIWSAGSGPQMNTYTHQNPNLWPGLTPIGMMQAFRNYTLTQDKAELEKQYAGFSQALEYGRTKLDLDKDGFPDFLIPKNNLGVAIWTYDNWNWSQRDGINAYNAGLWMVSLAAAARSAQVLGKTKDSNRFSALLEKCKTEFDKRLWKQTGEGTGYYKLGEHVEDVFSDYLYFLYDKALGLNVFSEDKVKMTLQTVFQNNVLSFGNGYIGAVNGTRNGAIIEGEQERETWSGASFALGATMIAYGMRDEGWQVIYGTENLSTNLAGNFGDWAEAYTLEPGVGRVPTYGLRAKNYYRALAIMDLLMVLRKSLPLLQ